MYYAINKCIIFIEKFNNLQIIERTDMLEKKVRNLKKTAFTMAEVLITLGVLGIVIAMTLPSIISKYQKKQTTTQLKKVYSTLKQATEFAKSKYGNVEDWDYNLDENTFLQTYYAPYLRTIINKESNTYNYTDLGGKKHNPAHPTLVLEDGTYIFIIIVRAFNNPFHIAVDINGNKSPNKMGRDLFVFSIVNNQFQTYDQYKDWSWSRKALMAENGTSGQCNPNAQGGILGPGCYCSKLIEYDGWEIKKDYPW